MGKKVHHSGFVADLAVVLGVAAITGFLFSRFKQPSILGYLLAGLIVGPYIPIPFFADPARVRALSEFGVVLVMFSVGLEFRLTKFLTVLPVSGATGVLEIAALFVAGYYLALGLGWYEVRALFLGACICVSSTMAVSKILEQHPVPKDLRKVIYGVLVLQDVAAIALIAVMTAISKGKEASVGEVFAILAKLSAALVAIVTAGMFFVPRLMRTLEATKSREVLVVGGVGLCFSFALLAEQFGYSAALGAFIGGVLVAESGLGHQVEKSTASVRDVFVAVFFVSIGMSVDPMVAWETLPTSLMVLAVVVVTQFVSVVLAGTASGNGLKASITAGLALGQIGEFAFIIGGIGVSANILNNQFQSILVTVAVLSTFTTSLALRFRGPIVRFLEKATPERILRLLHLYESWWQKVREPTMETNQRVRGLFTTIVLDVVVMGGVILSWQMWRVEIRRYFVRTFQMPEEGSETLASVALGLSLLPLLLTLLITSRTLARKLADRVFDTRKSNARAVMTAGFLALFVAVIGIPASFVLGRVVGNVYVWPAFLVTLSISGWLVWRRVGSLESELHSGGLLVLQTIAGQGFSDVERQSRTSLMGIKDLLEVTLKSGDHAVGKTLALLDLRSHTGANVVALKLPDGSTSIPSGVEIFVEETVIFLAGSLETQEAAERLLRDGPPDLES